MCRANRWVRRELCQPISTRCVAKTLLVAALLLPSPAAAQNDPLIYLDTEMLEGLWETVVTDSGAGESYTAERQPVTGNPNGFRWMSFELPTAGKLSATHRYFGGVYNPSAGEPLGGLVVTIDHREVSDNLDRIELGHDFLVFQDGEIFSVNLAGCCSADWTVEGTATRCLHPEDFENDNQLQPDFSASGEMMFFGFRTSVSNTATDGARSVAVGVDNFRVLTFDTTDPTCTANPADLRLHGSDGGHEWGDDPVIPYAIRLVNEGGPISGLSLENIVPEHTTFSDDDSTPGWACDPDVSAGSTCTFPLGNVDGGGAEKNATFAVRVVDGTDPMTDIYQEVGLISTIGRRRRPQDGIDCKLCTMVQANLCNIHQRHSDLCCFLEFITGEVCPFYDFFFPRQRAAIPIPERPLFDNFIAYRLRDRALPETRGGRRTVELYYEHNANMVDAALADPNILTLALTALKSWETILRSVADPDGAYHPDFQTIFQVHVDDLNAFLDALRAVANGALGEAIDRERPRLDLANWVGLTATQLRARLHRLSCPGSEVMLPCGALNGDCVVSATDALIALGIAVGKFPFDPASDNDGNGTTTATDALSILRVGVGKDEPSTACGI